MCGILGIYSDKNISKDLYYGLYSMQHRGQESCGMAVHDGKEITTWFSMEGDVACGS